MFSAIAKPLVICIAALSVAFGAWWAAQPNFTHCREDSTRVKCASNLRQIGTGLQLYAQDHRGEFPDTLATLLLKEDLVPEVFICPTGTATAARSNDAFAANVSPANCSYLYFGDGVNLGAVTDQDILAYEQPADHDRDGINVLFGDCHVEFIQPWRRDKPALAWWLDIEGQIARHARPIRMPPAATQPATGPTR